MDHDKGSYCHLHSSGFTLSHLLHKNDRKNSDQQEFTRSMGKFLITCYLLLIAIFETMESNFEKLFLEIEKKTLSTDLKYPQDICKAISSTCFILLHQLSSYCLEELANRNRRNISHDVMANKGE